MLGFQVLQLLHQLVEVEVADFRLVEDVVEVFVVADFFAEGVDLFSGVFCGGHRGRIIFGRRSSFCSAIVLPAGGPMKNGAGCPPAPR